MLSLIPTLKSSSRRYFLVYLARWLGASCTGLFLGLLTNSRQVWAKKLSIPLSKIPALQKEGGSQVISLKGKKILLVRKSATSIAAISPICTHEKCEVAYKLKTKRLFCKCHNSDFELNGTVRAGPAPRPLVTYDAKLSKDRIILNLDQPHAS